MGHEGLLKDYLELVRSNTGWHSDSLDRFQKKLMNWLKHGLVVAASGGPDSQLLVFLLYCVSRNLSVRPAITFHLDHGLREQSAADADLVRQTASALDLTHYEEYQDVEGFARKMKMNLEAAARFLRYRDLFRVCKLSESEYCATGHHAGDFVETALQRWIRSSSRELKDILPVESQMPVWSSLRKSRRFLGHLNIVRPLLLIHRQQILELIQAHSIPFVHDASNQDPAYLRNFLRSEVLPALYDRGLNPASLWSVNHDPLQQLEHSSGTATEPQPFVRIPGQLWKSATLSELATLLRLSLKSLCEEMVSGPMVQEIYSGLQDTGHRWMRVQNTELEFWCAGQDLWIYRRNGEITRPPRIERLTNPETSNSTPEGSRESDSMHHRSREQGAQISQSTEIQANASSEFESDAPEKVMDYTWKIEWLGTKRLYHGVQGAEPASRVSRYRFKTESGMHTGKIKTLFQKESLPPPVRENLPVIVDGQGYAVRACLSFLGQQDRIFFLA